jgi:divalent metal cation (Fe/Co/Zn/Cd) transporter
MSTPSVDLPMLVGDSTRAQSVELAAADRDELIHQAKVLSWLSLAYMAAEGAIAITAALVAGSVALLGFGLDSGIEAIASVIVIWRFTGARRLSLRAEQSAERLVAFSFFLLAPYIAQDALRTLIDDQRPGTTWLGIALLIASVVLMPLLGRAKQRIGQLLGSRATAGEGTQNMLCAYLAAGVLVGLVLNAAFGLWWADPAVALGIAGLALNEGREMWRGQGCCMPAPTPDTGVGDCCDQGSRR